MVARWANDRLQLQPERSFRSLSEGGEPDRRGRIALRRWPRQETHLWSKDGKYLLYTASDPKTRNDLWVLPLTGERKPFLPIVQTPFDESYGQFSPDGGWITYMSAESQGNQIHVVPFAGAHGVQGGKRQISATSGRFPRWRSDGSEIFFFTQDRRLMAAEMTARDGTMQVGGVSELFGGLTYAGTIEYDASLDGRQFIVLTAPEQKTPSALTLVQNWTADLGR